MGKITILKNDQMQVNTQFKEYHSVILITVYQVIKPSSVIYVEILAVQLAPSRFRLLERLLDTGYPL